MYAIHWLVGSNIGYAYVSMAPDDCRTRTSFENASFDASIIAMDEPWMPRSLFDAPYANVMWLPSGAQSGCVPNLGASGITPMFAPIGAPVAPSSSFRTPPLALMTRVAS